MENQLDTFRASQMKNLELHLVDYSQLYVLIGMLEIVLQRVIPEVLTIHAQKRGLNYWHEGLPLSDKGEKALSTALNRTRQRGHEIDGLNAQRYLPLSFWRYLVRSTTYTELWTPSLFGAFPNLVAGKEFASFKVLDQKLGMALRIRNHVAHYELEEIRRIKQSARVILWLLNSIDEAVANSAQRWLSDTSRLDPIQ